MTPVEEQLTGLGAFLRDEVAAGRGYLPAGRHILRAFTQPLDAVRVLVVGQDPYPTPGHPIGLSFADFQERTKRARSEVRSAIRDREAPWYIQTPRSRHEDRVRRGMKVSPVRHVVYRDYHAPSLDTIAQVKRDARAKWEAKRVSLVSAAFLPAYEACKYRRSQSSWLRIAGGTRL